MDAARFAKVRELFDLASELAGAEREEFLGTRGVDAEVRAAVESLLASHECAGEFLSRPAGEQIVEEWDGADPMVGFALASYRITGVLGEGGMGAVYRAQQESPRREVALKVIRGGWSTPGLRPRFAQEAATPRKPRQPGNAPVIVEGGSGSPGSRGGGGRRARGGATRRISRWNSSRARRCRRTRGVGRCARGCR